MLLQIIIGDSQASFRCERCFEGSGCLPLRVLTRLATRMLLIYVSLPSQGSKSAFCAVPLQKWKLFLGVVLPAPHLISLVQLLNFCQSDIRIRKISEFVHLNKLNF